MPLFGYKVIRDLESLNRNGIMHVLFPAAFIVQQLLKFLSTDSWRANPPYLMSAKAN